MQYQIVTSDVGKLTGCLKSNLQMLMRKKIAYELFLFLNIGEIGIVENNRARHSLQELCGGDAAVAQAWL